MELKKILIIEDEESIADLLSYSLKKEGFLTNHANEGMLGIDLIKTFKPNLIILDLMLPDISGFDVCKIISSEYLIPIIIITAKLDTMDKILGIELGADDYITKPFNIREVIARIRAIFRRMDLISKMDKENLTNIIKLKNNVEIVKDERRVMKDDKEINLTKKEYDLLFFLSENAGRIFSRMEILDKIWGLDYAYDTRTVDIHVQRIRKKIDNDKKNSIIETVFGIGYKYVD
ncbi:MAG: response regulator transcription factor [Clostridiaceae bacterium]